MPQSGTPGVNPSWDGSSISSISGRFSRSQETTSHPPPARRYRWNKEAVHGTEHIGSLKDQFPLYTGKLPGFLRRPVSGKSFFLAEHSFAGAGGIQKDFMEKFREAFPEAGRCLVGDKGVGEAKKFYIAKQGTGTRSTDVIGDQKSFAVLPCASSVVLPPGAAQRSSTFSPGRTGQAGCRSHGAGFLKIIKPCLIKRTVRRAHILRIKITVWNPGNRRYRERNEFFKFLAADLGSVDAKAVGSW